MLSLGQTIADVRITDEFRGAMSNSIYLAYTLDDSDREYLVTCGPSQTRPLSEVRKDFWRSVPGMQPPLLVDAVDGPFGSVQVLIERTPVGRPLVEIDRPLSAQATARLLLQTAARVAKAHERGVVVYGVRPELVWAENWNVDRDARDRELSITGITPYTMYFLLGMKPARGGLCLDDAYSPREVWLKQACGPAVDVFGLCALGYFLQTGRPPFPAEGNFNRAIEAILVGVQPDWTGVALANILAPGLAPEPSQRPTLAWLTSKLAALALN